MCNKNIEADAECGHKWDLIGLLPQTSPTQDWRGPSKNQPEKKKTADSVSSSVIAVFLFIFWCAPALQRLHSKTLSLILERYLFYSWPSINVCEGWQTGPVNIYRHFIYKLKSSVTKKKKINHSGYKSPSCEIVGCEGTRFNSRLNQKAVGFCKSP